MALVVPVVPPLSSDVGSTASVPTGAGNTVVKGSPGTLYRLTVTTANTSASGVFTIYDNATTNSGTPLAAINANSATGTTLEIRASAVNGITANNVANGPVVTVIYS